MRMHFGIRYLEGKSSHLSPDRLISAQRAFPLIAKLMYNIGTK
jgi:hypothetical protein